MGSELSPENEAFVKQEIATAEYSSRQDILDAGVELLRNRMALLSRMAESRRQLDEGEFNDYDEDSLAKRFESLGQVDDSGLAE